MSKRSEAERPDFRWETALARAMGRYCSPGSSYFDSEFRAKLSEIAPLPPTWEEVFEDIKVFSEENRRFPASTSPSDSEKKLGTALRNYCNGETRKLCVMEWRGSHPEWRNAVPWEETFEGVKNWVDAHSSLPGGAMRVWLVKNRTDESVAQWLLTQNLVMRDVITLDCFDTSFGTIKSWAETNSKFPAQNACDPHEKKLGQKLANLLKHNRRHEVTQWMEAHPEFLNKRGRPRGGLNISSSAEELMNWCSYHQKFPSVVSDDLTERRLGRFLQRQKSAELVEWRGSHPEWKNKRGPR